MSPRTRNSWVWSSLDESTLCEDEKCAHPVIDHECHTIHPRLSMGVTGRCSVKGCSCLGAASSMIGEYDLVVSIVGDA